MADEEKKYSRSILGRTVITKGGKRFGEVGNLVFEIRTGELIHISLKNATAYTEGLDLERDKAGNPLIPFAAVLAVGDFVVVAEEDLV